MITLDLIEPVQLSRTLGDDEVRSVFERTDAAGGPAFTWTRDPDTGESLIIGLIDAENCYVSWKNDVDWFNLCHSDDSGFESWVEVELGGLDAWVLEAAIVPREVGLDVLLSAPAIASPPANYTWTQQAT